MYSKTITNNNIKIICILYIMALVSTFKPKYNVPELWINPLNGGNFFMYTKNYNNGLSIKDNTYMYIYLLEFLKVCKCKILFSINSNSLTRYLYKDYIKENYKHVYQSSHINIEGLSLDEKGNKIRKKNTNVLIISNF
jgi:hypothetical protein